MAEPPGDSVVHETVVSVENHSINLLGVSAETGHVQVVDAERCKLKFATAQVDMALAD